MAKILLIDDDEQIGSRLARYFEQFGLDLHCAVHPNEGLERHLQNDFDLIILDIMMPDIDGMELCKMIRQLPPPKCDIPILMLSARGDVMDRVIGIEIGADDYLPKPFEPRELIVRVQAIIKRSTRVALAQASNDDSQKTVLQFEDLRIELAHRQVFLNDTEIVLTTSEYHLLIFLAQSAGKNFTRDEILNALKGIDTELYSRAVDVLVSRLRNKLKPKECIKTVWGSGYSFIGIAQ